jgi:peptide deformylase
MMTTNGPNAMAVLPVILAPDLRLRITCTRVDAVDTRVRQLMDDMVETMYAAPGVGLSAPQVGDGRRIIVVDCAPPDDRADLYRMVNPEIFERGTDLRIGEEGCLSLPEHFAEVERTGHVRVRYRDETDTVRELDAEGMLAACIQHEMDHLEGMLFVDHLSQLKGNMILRKMKKFKKQQAAKAA